MLSSFLAFPKYNGGVNLSVGDLNGDGRADIVLGTDSGSKSLVRVYDGTTIRAGSPPMLLVEFEPFGSESGGVRVALVDLDGDGVNELVIASARNGSKVKPKAFKFRTGGLSPAVIDAFFARYATDPRLVGALFLAGGNS
jgi:hypothetical protein